MKKEEKQEEGSDGRGSQLRNAGLALTIPTMLAATMIVAVVIGYFLDKWLGTNPWLLLLFLVLGVIAAVRETIRLVRKMDEKD